MDRESDPAGSTDTFMWTVGREIRVQTPHKSVEPAVITLSHTIFNRVT